MKHITAVLLIISLLFSCKTDDPETPNQLPNISERKIIVANEGNFGSGNAEIGLWGLESNTYAHGIYSEANDEVFGDTFQSYHTEGERVFWVLNGSGKIVVTDLEGVKIGEISGLNSPRYFLPINGQLAYVTNLYSSDITVVNHQNYTIDHTFSTFEEASEELFMIEDKVYAIGSTLVDDVNYIYDYSVMEINTSDESIGYTPIPHSVMDVDVTTEGNLILVGSNNSFEPKISTYYSNTQIIEESLTNISAGSISKVSVNENTNAVFGLLDGDVYALDFINNTTTLFTDLELGYGYGFRVDSEHNEIYVCDADDFVNSGKVYRISSEGEVLNEVTAGPLPKDVFIP